MDVRSWIGDCRRCLYFSGELWTGISDEEGRVKLFMPPGTIDLFHPREQMLAAITFLWNYITSGWIACAWNCKNAHFQSLTCQLDLWTSRSFHERHRPSVLSRHDRLRGIVTETAKWLPNDFSSCISNRKKQDSRNKSADQMKPCLWTQLYRWKNGS